MSLNIKGDSKPKIRTPKSNVFTDTAGTTANEGIHQAVVTQTKHVGRIKTKYGTKDFQMFHLQVSQFNPESGEHETAEIHQQYHRSLNPRSALVPFLAALGIRAHRGMTLDFDDLVGKKLNIVVTHSTDVNGVKHANVRPLPLKGVSQ
jgi:hypothetical protein